MAVVRMYWDRSEDLQPLDGRVPALGLEVEGQHWQESSDVPPNACGFMLGPPPWRGYWRFSPPGRESEVFERFDVRYESTALPDWGDVVLHSDRFTGAPVITAQRSTSTRH